MTSESEIEANNADKSRSRGKSVDMSPEAVLRRLEICGDLSDVCRELARQECLDRGTLRRKHRVVTDAWI